MTLALPYCDYGVGGSYGWISVKIIFYEQNQSIWLTFYVLLFFKAEPSCEEKMEILKDKEEENYRQICTSPTLKDVSFVLKKVWIICSTQKFINFYEFL